MENSVTTPDELLRLLYQFQSLTIFQIVRLLGKEKSINNIRSKLKRLVDLGLADTQFLARAANGGRSPLCYSISAKGCKYLEVSDTQKIKGMLPMHHLLQINDVLITSLLLPRVEPAIQVFEWRHEKIFKQNAIHVSENTFLAPDAFVHFVLSPPFGKPGEPMGIIFEIDRNTEDVYTIRNKIKNYRAVFYGDFEQVFGLRNLSLAFVVTSGGTTSTRVRQLVRFTEQELQRTKEDAELFLFTSVNTEHLQPLPFFTAPVWSQPFCPSPVPLIERRG